MAAGNKEHATVPGKRSKRVKAIFGLLATLVFFAAAELFLAIVGFSPRLADRDPYVGFESSHPLFVSRTDNGKAYFETAQNKLDYFNPQRFPKRKAEHTIRIFCLGGSTTYGRPYDDSTSFVGWLRELLQVAATGQRFEVINAGGISYASYRITALMQELRNYDPDLFVVYTGHNEFLEERTYRDLTAQPALVRRLTNLLGKTRTYSFAHKLWWRDQVGSFLLPGEVDAILDHTAGPDTYHRNDSLREDVLRHFEFNLARIIEIARDNGAQLLFVTPASNAKDFSPFKSELSETLNEIQRKRWHDLFTTAVVMQDSDVTGALTAFTKAMEIDSRYAELHFRRGRLLFAQGRFAEARAAFLEAVDEDVCPLRAFPEIQQIVEHSAVRHNVPLVDFNNILRTDCLHFRGHDILGKEYFVDHVHPTVAAHGLLAVAVLDAMVQMRLVSPTVAWRTDGVTRASTRIHARVDHAVQARALTNLAKVLSWAGKQVEAGPIALQAVQLRTAQGLEDDPQSMFYAGVHLATLGSDVEATKLLQKVVQLEPDNAQAQWRLASLLYDQKQYNMAKQHFTNALRLNPHDEYSGQMLDIVSAKIREQE